MISVAADAACNISGFGQTMLDAVIQARTSGRTCGTSYYPPVAAPTWNEKLTQAAAAHSAEMASNDYFPHTSLDGRTFKDRIDATGYLDSSWGENIYAGTGDVSVAVSAWLARPGHCANIVNASFRDFGAACVQSASSAYGK